MPIWQTIAAIKGSYSSAKGASQYKADGLGQAGWLRHIARLARQLADEADTEAARIESLN